jgi:hypothetical protein
LNTRVTGPPEQKTTLADIGITKTREERIFQAIAESYSASQSNLNREATRKRLEAIVHDTKDSKTVARAISQVLVAISQVQHRQKEEEL